MGRYNFAPQRVHQAATRLLETQRLLVPPPWYDVIANLPPSERLVRPALQGAKRKGRKASRLFQPVKIEYQEDRLRSDFFGDHPWELARPRQILEDDGKDYQRYSWSQIEQPGKQLDGESVVQRQAWLMELLRHELEFTCPRALRDYLRSDEFQDGECRMLKSEYNVDVQCLVPSEGQDAQAHVTLAINVSYHPREQHDSKNALKHLATLLAARGLDKSSINQRHFDVALPDTEALAQILDSSEASNALFAKLKKDFNVSASVQPPLTFQSFGEDPQKFLSIQLSYHRNNDQGLASAISSLSSSLNISPASLIHPSLPTADPDTFNAYSKSAAYDVARKEFYALRHRQEIERRVAREEALFTGAEFGPSALDVGMQLEDQKYEDWRVWAAAQIATQKQQQGAAYTGNEAETMDLALDDPATQEGLNEVSASAPASK
ncbi:hypothetical protein MBLNU459_g6287t1 [Dothideomycetes sp. NU459]